MKQINYFFAVLFFILFAFNAYAQKKNDRILFLEFRFVKGTPQIVEMTAVTGKLKTRKGAVVSKPGYSFEVLSKKNKILYKNSIENPAETVYEYPGENGEIKRTGIKKDTANVTIRVPYCTNIDKIILYKVVDASALFKSSNTSPNEKYEFTIDHTLIKKEK